MCSRHVAATVEVPFDSLCVKPLVDLEARLKDALWYGVALFCFIKFPTSGGLLLAAAVLGPDTGPTLGPTQIRGVCGACVRVFVCVRVRTNRLTEGREELYGLTLLRRSTRSRLIVPEGPRVCARRGDLYASCVR